MVDMLRLCPEYFDFLSLFFSFSLSLHHSWFIADVLYYYLCIKQHKFGYLFRSKTASVVSQQFQIHKNQTNEQKKWSEVHDKKKSISDTMRQRHK